MRILIINALYPPIQVGGAEKAAKLLADALVQDGNHVVVISLHSGANQIVERDGGISIYRLPMDNSYWPFGATRKQGRVAKFLWHLRDVWNVRAARRVAGILDIETPDVVHTHNLSGFSMSVWHEVKKRNIRLVHTLHDYYLLCPRSNMFRHGACCEERCLACKAWTLVPKASSTQPDAVVSVSEAVLNTHLSCGYFPSVPSSVIYNIEPSIERLTTICSTSRGADNHELIFGFIGKLSEAKGIATLLQATTFLTGAWRLRIAGTGYNAYIAELKNRFPDRRIEWLGYADSQSFYASIDVTVVPSVWSDPLPYVVIESFAAGKGVICAESGGLPELASLGKRVLTYPATDIQALVRALEHALSNRELWRRGGFKTADSSKLFERAAVTRRYRAVYESTFTG